MYASSGIPISFLPIIDEAAVLRISSVSTPLNITFILSALPTFHDLHQSYLSKHKKTWEYYRGLRAVALSQSNIEKLYILILNSNSKLSQNLV